MLKFKSVVLAIGLSLASSGVMAEVFTDFEDKVFLLGQDKSLGKGYLVHDGLKLTSVRDDESLHRKDTMASAMFFYQKNRLKLAAVNSDGYQRCLTNIGNDQIEFRICDDKWSAQDFHLEEKHYKDGSYQIKNGNQCVTKSTPFSLKECSDIRDIQEFTPSMVTTPITYTIINENYGAQHVRLGFKWNPYYEYFGNPNLWLEAFTVPGRSTVTKLIPDYTAYGLHGNSWFYNATYSDKELDLLDKRAGDSVSIRMPLLAGSKIRTNTISAEAPTIAAADGTTFRIADNQGAVAIWNSKGISSWTIPKGWILTVYPSSNYEGTPTSLISDTPKEKMPERAGSIAIAQRAGYPIRMRSEDDGSWRNGELVVTVDETDYPVFYRGQEDLGLERIGPVFAADEPKIGEIRALAERYNVKNEASGFYIRKQLGDAPFSDSSTWEPLRIGSWLSRGTGMQGELYFSYHSYSNMAFLWLLKHTGAGHQCLPLSIEDENWLRLGIVFGKFNSDDHIDGVRLYSDKGYVGYKVKVTQDIADLCDMSDSISSYTIPAGWEVQFFTGKNFTGKKYTRTGSSSNLGGFDNLINSIKITKSPSTFSADHLGEGSGESSIYE